MHLQVKPGNWASTTVSHDRQHLADEVARSERLVDPYARPKVAIGKDTGSALDEYSPRVQPPGHLGMRTGKWENGDHAAGFDSANGGARRAVEVDPGLDIPGALEAERSGMR
jgi:hypothetical protein